VVFVLASGKFAASSFRFSAMELDEVAKVEAMEVDGKEKVFNEVVFNFSSCARTRQKPSTARNKASKTVVLILGIISIETTVNGSVK
jgi:hypothetical protein